MDRGRDYLIGSPSHKCDPLRHCLPHARWPPPCCRLATPAGLHSFTPLAPSTGHPWLRRRPRCLAVLSHYQPLPVPRPLKNLISWELIVTAATKQPQKPNFNSGRCRHRPLLSSHCTAPALPQSSPSLSPSPSILLPDRVVREKSFCI
jgi:hypothetical protein